MLVLSSVLDVVRPALRVEAEPTRLQNSGSEVRGAYCCQLRVEGLRNQGVCEGSGESLRGYIGFPTRFDNQDSLETKIFIMVRVKRAERDVACHTVR